jgi:hypothetical protein
VITRAFAALPDNRRWTNEPEFLVRAKARVLTGLAIDGCAFAQALRRFRVESSKHTKPGERRLASLKHPYPMEAFPCMQD